MDAAPGSPSLDISDAVKEEQRREKKHGRSSSTAPGPPRGSGASQPPCARLQCEGDSETVTSVKESNDRKREAHVYTGAAMLWPTRSVVRRLLFRDLDLRHTCPNGREVRRPGEDSDGETVPAGRSISQVIQGVQD